MNLTDRRTHDRRASVRRAQSPTKKAQSPIAAAKLMMAEVVPDSDNASEIRAICSHVIQVLCEQPIPDDPKAQLCSALDSVSDNVVVLDNLGNIIMTNIAWQHFALVNSPQSGQATPHSDVGTNYSLEVASRCINAHDGSSQAVEGIREVLSGHIEGFKLTYPCHTPDEQHWFTMTVTSLEWEGKRSALVKHTDTTPCHHLQQA